MKAMIQAQRIEETEFRIYTRLAKTTKDAGNSEVLHRIAKLAVTPDIGP